MDNYKIRVADTILEDKLDAMGCVMASASSASPLCEALSSLIANIIPKNSV